MTLQLYLHNTTLLFSYPSMFLGMHNCSSKPSSATPGRSRSWQNFIDSCFDSNSSQNSRLRPTPTPASTTTLQHCCLVPMKHTKRKKSMLALIVINQMGIRSQTLSSRQRAPPSVYPSANGVRAPPHLGKNRVNGAPLRLRGAPGWVPASGRGAVREKIGFAAG